MAEGGGISFQRGRLWRSWLNQGLNDIMTYSIAGGHCLASDPCCDSVILPRFRSWVLSIRKLNPARRCLWKGPEGTPERWCFHTKMIQNAIPIYITNRVITSSWETHHICRGRRADGRQHNHFVHDERSGVPGPPSWAYATPVSELRSVQMVGRFGIITVICWKYETIWYHFIASVHSITF